jgi:lysophospholipase L1-like esterase
MTHEDDLMHHRIKRRGAIGTAIGRVGGFCVLLMAIVVACSCSSPAQAVPACRSEAWVGAWTASASDASRGLHISDLFDGSLNPKLPVRDATVRAVLTPTFGGSTVRVRLSNRFGRAPVTFGSVAIAKQRAGANVTPGTSAALTFAGARRVSVPAGRELLSDRVRFTVAAFERVAVSAYVRGDAGRPTEHFSARQTSYMTLPGAGDHVGDDGAFWFSVKTTSRPFVTGLDVLAPARVGALVGLGDSLTDGYQSSPPGFLEAATGIDGDARWPDVLARRLRAAGHPLAVLNAGISGNRVLRDGTEGGQADTNGPSALQRLHDDVLQQAGVSSVLLWEGINDLGMAPNATAAQLIAGYEQLIERIHRAGLPVLHGTLTPTGGADGDYGSAATGAERRAVNAWIRTLSPADDVIDFDHVVSDPANLAQIDPAYDAGDHLHLNVAGYEAIGAAIGLDLLRQPACAGPLRVTVSPRHVRVGRHATLRILVRSHTGVRVRGAVISLAARRARTDARGRARIRLRFARRGLVRVVASAAGAERGLAHVRVLGARAPQR